MELCAPELLPDVDWPALPEELGCELLKVKLCDAELLSDTDWLAPAEELLVEGPEVLYVLDDAADLLELSWDEEEDTDTEAEDEE